MNGLQGDHFVVRNFISGDFGDDGFGEKYGTVIAMIFTIEITIKFISDHAHRIKFLVKSPLFGSSLIDSFNVRLSIHNLLNFSCFLGYKRQEQIYAHGLYALLSSSCGGTLIYNLDNCI